MIEMYEQFLPYKYFVWTIVTLFGLFVGSFLNVVALRLLKNESIVFPASHCPKCNEPIKPYDNIPVLSYFVLGGKCRKCKDKISIQYPIVEFTTGVLFLLCVLTFGLSIKTLAMMIVIAALVVITVTDLYEQLIFDITSLTLVPIGLLYNFFNLGHVDRPDFVFQIFPKSFPLEIPYYLIDGQIHLPGIFASAIVGIIIAVIFFEGLSYLSEVALGKYGFGMGDTKLCAGLAAFFGWEMLVVIIIISFLAQAVIGIPVIFYNIYKEKDMKSFYALLATIIFAAVPVLLNAFVAMSSQVAVIIMLVCFVIVITALIIFMKRSKERQSFSYLPLGPAIVLGAIIIIFYGDDILKWALKGFSLL
ncbi:MAG: prepilin peptidase [Cyanobacteriota bacterium]